MKKIIYLFTAIALAFVYTSCASKKNGSNTSNKEVEQVVLESGKVSKQDSLFASLERGICFGKCPVFNFNIYKSGYATYEGKNNTSMIGLYSTKFEKADLEKLRNLAKEINYMSLEDVYDTQGITDLPTHISSIVIDNQRKVVKRRHNYPETVVVMETNIEQLINNTNWTKLRD